MRVAITGGIAEGKSTVLAALAERGYRVASADAVARELFDRPDIQTALANLLQVDGLVTRPQLREAIALKPAIRRAVNAIMHPAIRTEMAATGAQFYEIPLLIESGLAHRYDQVWVVTCGAELQLERLGRRLNSLEQAKRLIATQLPTSAKIPFADWVVDTRKSSAVVAALVQQKADSFDF